MLFSKKCCALFLSCLILSVQARTDCRDGKCKPGNDDLFYSVIGRAAVGGAAAAVAAPLVAGALGFGAGGIVAGPVGASVMSGMAPTAAGGVVATLQSIGAAGLAVRWVNEILSPLVSNTYAVNKSTLDDPSAIGRGFVILMEPLPQIDNNF
ncbi:PREDICTED: interferon alpha-inducible protein 6-like [Amphimedon queenslandica]|uniref:Uncharacterized protein n=1 Tax=Amphimedon queenslandica TaxID=400682 RepID=A0A1X7ST13_AMPQE|nr:PREDICTED: interferon alpha-inducible protein 6-like [Amphimedon queenslandica]|eukprot:XP_019862868.1 PREDICTED: interferon alpha-inducible protein 6-like [Amphimedon queenslandica]